jgi:hypothetical protein
MLKRKRYAYNGNAKKDRKRQMRNSQFNPRDENPYEGVLEN